MSYIVLVYCMLTTIFCNCRKSIERPLPPPLTLPAADTLITIATDKACYDPGDEVSFTVDKNLPATAKIRYWYLDSMIAETAFNGRNWTWQAPPVDFRGYLMDIYSDENGKEKIYGSIAVDVSSDWTHFPRYGFLSDFGQLNESYMDSVMSILDRYHLNGLQFYDWEYEHHLPLAGTVSNPDSSWRDIANRINYRSTVKRYISLAHQYNMKAMSYNLVYGALSDAASAGVSDQWYMYTDLNHVNKEGLDLPMPPFKSNIYLLDPSNPGWQNYIAAKTLDAYAVYDFDGYHVDQLGNLNKNLYTYSGTAVNLESTFGPFLAAMKTLTPYKRLVMNAVNQYGQQVSIAQSPVDFLYTEVWTPNEGYRDLATIIQNNDLWTNNTKKTVLAAYMDYNLANNPGYFNTPGVLLTDAVIFAFGGAHIELGEHMLCKEYFPNGNLQMKNDLFKALVRYYDFLVAYEDILRGGGSFNAPNLVSADGKIQITNWPPVTGSVSMIGKLVGNRQVIHLINFANAVNFDWRDANGSQAQPQTFLNLAVSFTATKTVKKVWLASPDINGGVSEDIPFRQSGNSISFTLPSLQYWDMVVIAY